MKLLIVDDEIFAIQGILTGVSWGTLDYESVLQANSYTQAVDEMKTQNIDVVLCDIEMPGESGLELIRWIRDNCPDTECIILSCHDEFDYARQAVKLDCMEYVLKPVRYDYLTEVLRKASASVKERRQHQTLEDYGKLYIRNMSPPQQNSSADIVSAVTDYIDAHLRDDLNVTVLARMAYVSPDHLTRVFKKKKGLTVSDYIKQRRMIVAKHLLADQRMTITMVADMVGYSNYSYFIEQFKKFTGMTPKAYQKMTAKEE